MRKWLCIGLVLSLLLMLTACGVGETTSSAVEQSDPTASSTTSTSATTTTITDADGNKVTTSRHGGELAPPTTTTGSTTTTTGIVETIKEDKPTTYNTAILYNEQHSTYDDEAEAMRLSILNTKDTIRATGTTYYISSTGNDASDGKSTATAWRTLKNLQTNSPLKAGDAVLFERGGVYRGAITLKSGVSYGAYGNGPKPCIYGSPRNYAYASLWEKAGTNVWRVNVGEDMGDVGNIVFDHGKACASGGKKLGKLVKNDFEFYHDRTNGYVYLYLTKGNPGSLYDSIEICPHVFPLRGARDTTDVTIENLCIKYTGAHAISFSTGAKNITIRGCEIGYIGGSMQTKTVRYGNGVEFVDLCSNITVENNWVYQCYDAGLTHQSSNSAGFYVDNLTFRNNLVEYCVYNIEFFFHTEKGGYRNHLYEGNVLRFAGYGFGTLNRIGGSDEVIASINGWRGQLPSQNFVIRNNVLDTSYRYLFVMPYVDGKKGPTLTGNTWIQHEDTKSAVAMMKDSAVSGSAKELKAGDLATMKDSVKVLDKSPKAVIWE